MVTPKTCTHILKKDMLSTEQSTSLEKNTYEHKIVNDLLCCWKSGTSCDYLFVFPISGDSREEQFLVQHLFMHTRFHILLVETERPIEKNGLPPKTE